MGDRVETYCQAPGCDLPTKEGRRFCPRDTKRDQRRRAGRSAPPLGAPAAERLPPMERAIEAMAVLMETPAEDEVAYAGNRRALEAVLRELGRRATPEAIRGGMARARARGVHVGRPSKLQPDDPRIRALSEEFGLALAARVLGVDRKTLAKTLRRREEGTLSPSPSEVEPGKKGTLSPHREAGA